MGITWPSNTTEIIDAIRGAIGRNVTFYTYTLSGCSTCSLNPVDNSSTDAYCPECGGIYWVPTYSGTVVSGHVTWGHSDELGWPIGGQIFEGDCRIQIKYETGTITMLDNTEYIEVDGKKVEIKKRIYRGVQDINRVLLDCIEREKEA